MPLVLSHGWPDSFWRYAKVIPLLTDPGVHGADPADAFDVVAPDMPGYGYSDRPIGPPLDSIAVAGLWAELMGVLMYPRFGAAGGDIGSHVSRYLALDHPDRVVAVHRTDAGVPVFTGHPADLGPKERAWLESAAAWGATEGAYAAMHRTKPQTAAFGLTDSPAGLAAWIVEKLRSWSDCGGEIERRFTKDEIPHERNALLDHGHDRLVDAHVPRQRRHPARAARPPGRRAVRLLALSRRHRPPAPSVARAHSERRTCYRARPRRALRAVRGARAIRGGAARLFPPVPSSGLGLKAPPSSRGGFLASRPGGPPPRVASDRRAMANESGAASPARPKSPRNPVRVARARPHSSRNSSRSIATSRPPKDGSRRRHHSVLLGRGRPPRWPRRGRQPRG